MKAYTYKESNVSWIGKVPSHWLSMRLKDTVESCVNGIWGDDAVGDGTDTPVVRVADFDRPSRSASSHPTLRQLRPEQIASRLLEVGDLLIEKSGGGEQQPVGMVVQYQGLPGAVTSNFVARMRPRDFVCSGYLNYLHAHFYERSITTLSIKQSTGIQNLDSAAYLGERCFVPPIDEQLSITRYLDAETAQIDALIAQKEAEIALLRELRSATITEAVLGHVDVRDANATVQSEEATA